MKPPVVLKVEKHQANTKTQNMRKHIGYKVETGSDFDLFIWFRGLITYFDGEGIVVTHSDRFAKKEDAWKWIGSTLSQWENTAN